MAPTFVAKYGPASNDTSTSPKTAAVTTAAGDLLVVIGFGEQQTPVLTPTGNSLVWTKQNEQNGTASRGYAVLWTAIDAVGGTGWTLTMTNSGTLSWFGFVVTRWSGAAVGASAGIQGVTTFSNPITTTAANSALVGGCVDWAAGTGAETWRTINSITPTAANAGEDLHFVNSAHYGIYAAHWGNVGATGSYDPTPTAPSPGGFSCVAVEVKASASGPPPAGPPRGLWLPKIIAADRAARW